MPNPCPCCGSGLVDNPVCVPGTVHTLSTDCPVCGRACTGCGTRGVPLCYLTAETTLCRECADHRFTAAVSDLFLTFN